MADTEAQMRLVYVVEVFRPDEPTTPWWRVGNRGTPGQVAAALTEVAARLEHELSTGTDAAGSRCRVRWELYRWDGTVLDTVETTALTALIPEILRGPAVTAATGAGRPGRWQPEGP